MRRRSPAGAAVVFLFAAGLLAAVFLRAVRPASATDCGAVAQWAGDRPFSEAAARAFSEALAENDCPDGSGPFVSTIEVMEATVEGNWNPKGMALAGGLSSARSRRGVARARVRVSRDGQVVFEDTVEAAGPTHELFSLVRKSGDVKKRAAENAGVELAKRFLAFAGREGAFKKPALSPGDFLKEDEDIAAILAGGLAATLVHESGHYAFAGLTGRQPEIAGNDRRTFQAGLELPLALSVLFSHRLNDDLKFPIPDVRYDFYPADGPGGLEYRDENGVVVSSGRRDAALIAQSGILFQNLTNERLLTRHPDLIDRDRPFEKGLFFFNLAIPSLYTVYGYKDENSDLKALQRALGTERWAVNAMVLAPAAIDLYRYYHPKKKKLRRYARIAKALPLIWALSK